jgi:hypothetical protein
MSSWIDILKKNDKEFETKLKKDDIVEDNIENIEDTNIKDVDDEFEREYSLIIHDIMFDFKEYIKEEQLPFMNKLNMTGKYLVEDFFKYFSINYNDIKDKVEKENEEYLKELEEEENELIEENSEYEKN